MIIALQVFTGALVTFGGAAFTVLAANPFGTALGATHLLLGMIGLSIGLLTTKRKSLPRLPLLVINTLTIAYSVLSVTIAAVQSLLPPAALHDSLIGTAVAVIVSSVIIYLLRRS